MGGIRAAAPKKTWRKDRLRRFPKVLFYTTTYIRVDSAQAGFRKALQFLAAAFYYQYDKKG